MNCREARELAAAAAFGDLDDALRDEFDAHLRECDDCRRALEESRQVLQAISGSGAACTPPDLAARTTAAGRRRLKLARRRRRLAYAHALAAAAALVLVATWIGVTRSPREEPCGCWRYVAGDPGNSRHSDYALQGTPDQVLWERRVQGMAGAYKPLAWKRLIIVGAHPRRKTHRGGGRLLAFDSVTGELRWQRDFASGDFYKAKSFPDRCILDGVLYVTDGHSCRAVELASGRQIRRIEPPAEAGSWGYLTGREGRLYGLSRNGRTAFCVDAAGGRTLWSRATGGRPFVAALAGGRLYLSDGNGALLALEAASGNRLWRGEGSPRGKASVHACKGHVLVINGNDEVAAFSTATGARRWKRRIEGAFASGAALGEGVAYLLAGTAAVALSDGRLIWNRGEDANGLCSAPTLTGNRILAAAGREAGSLNVFAATGRVEASFGGAARRACDGAIVAGGRVYAVGGGTLRALRCTEPG